MKILCVSTVGTADPTTASISFHIAANGCLEAGQETGVIIAGNAAELVVGDVLETLEGVGIPPLRELVAKLKEHDVPVYI
jgi:predicted peroxiredoxin